MLNVVGHLLQEEPKGERESFICERKDAVDNVIVVVAVSYFC